jgi:hypothetical protein
MASSGLHFCCQPIRSQRPADYADVNPLLTVVYDADSDLDWFSQKAV